MADRSLLVQDFQILLGPGLILNFSIWTVLNQSVLVRGYLIDTYINIGSNILICTPDTRHSIFLSNNWLIALKHLIIMGATVVSHHKHLNMSPTHLELWLKMTTHTLLRMATASTMNQRLFSMSLEGKILLKSQSNIRIHRKIFRSFYCNKRVSCKKLNCLAEIWCN